MQHAVPIHGIHPRRIVIFLPWMGVKFMDYFHILGGDARRDGGGDQARLPQARGQMPSRVLFRGPPSS